MVYSEEPIWPMPHIPALYDDGDYGGKKDRQTDRQRYDENNFLGTFLCLPVPTGLFKHHE